MEATEEMKKETEESALTVLVELVSHVLGKDIAPFASWNHDTHLREVGLDSLRTLELADALEAKYNQTVPDERLAQLRTVRDLLALIQDLQLS